MSYRLSLVCGLLILATTACDDAPNPVGPSTGTAPSADISDGRIQGGNDAFFFLPPLLPDPRRLSAYDAGGFHPGLRPTVSICRLAGDPGTTDGVDCSRNVDGSPILVASFAATDVRVSVADEHYSVNWHTDASSLATDAFYRLQVFVGSVRLGFLDIDPVSSGRDLTNRFTGEGIQLIDGRTLPIRFRIESGALCSNDTDCGEFTVTNAGGTFVTNTEDAGVQFRPGVLPDGVEEITLKIERVTVGADNRCHGAASARLWLEFEGCYDITSDPDLRPYGGLRSPAPNPDGSIPAPAIAGQCVEVSTTDPLFEYLQPYKSHNGGELLRLASAPAPFLDCEGFESSALRTGSAPSPLVRLASRGAQRVADGMRSLFGVRSLHAIDLGLGEELPIGSAFSRFGWAIGLELAGTTGGDQEVGFGLAASQPLEVHLRSLHSHPESDGADVNDDHPEDIEGIPVRFAVAEGDGYFELGADGVPVRAKDVLTGSDGRASVAFVASSNTIANVVTATTTTVDPQRSIATFSLVGLAPDLVVRSIRQNVAEPGIDDALAWVVTVANEGRGTAIASTARLVVSLETEEGTEAVASFDLAVPPIEPGKGVVISTPALSGPHIAGDYQVSVTANADDVVIEADEDRDVLRQEFTVSSRIIAIQSAPMAPAEVDGLVAPINVVVRDAAGQPMPGIPVTFTVLRGGSVLRISQATTNDIGAATLPAWRLGPTPIDNVIEVRAAGAPPVRVTVPARWARRFTVGSHAACALDLAGTTQCWGDNFSRQLGVPPTSLGFSAVPIAVAVPTFERLAVAGGQAFCGLQNDGSATCWGRATHGMLTIPWTTVSSAPVPTAGGPYIDLTIARLTGCGIVAGGTAFCWGSNQRGEIGSTSVPLNEWSSTPVQVEGSIQFTSIVAGWLHACGLTVDGSAYCWGQGILLGAGSRPEGDSRVPVPVSGGLTFAQLAIGPRFTCGLTRDGRAYCWGLNTEGGLGDGSTSDRLTPVAVVGGHRFASIHVSDAIAQPQGAGHACALTDAGEAYCWGANDAGQLGDGTTVIRLTPTPVAGGLTFTSLELGEKATCGMRANAVWCWGANDRGQLGDGTTIGRAAPARVARTFD